MYNNNNNTSGLGVLGALLVVILTVPLALAYAVIMCLLIDLTPWTLVITIWPALIGFIQLF